MNILIDSTEYKKDKRLTNENFSQVKVLGKYEFIKLHIPWFIYKECTTTSKNELKTELESIKLKLNSLGKKGADTFEDDKAKELSKQVEEIVSEIVNSNENLWEKFISESKAILYGKWLLFLTVCKYSFLD